MSNDYCEFADGPMKGRSDYRIPLDRAPAMLRFPVTNDLMPYEGAGDPAGFVEYEKRQDEGIWKYFLSNTDLSAEAVEAAVQQLKDFDVANALSGYTIEQLAREIARRETFASVVVYAVDEGTTGNVPAGSDVAVVPSKFFNGLVLNQAFADGRCQARRRRAA